MLLCNCTKTPPGNSELLKKRRKYLMAIELQQDVFWLLVKGTRTCSSGPGNVHEDANIPCNTQKSLASWCILKIHWGLIVLCSMIQLQGKYQKGFITAWCHLVVAKRSAPAEKKLRQETLIFD